MKINLDHFEIISKCEGNALNKIYIVKSKKDNKKYVLKIIPIQNQDSQLQEILIHQKLNHKFIIDLIDYDI